VRAVVGLAAAALVVVGVVAALGAWRGGGDQGLREARTLVEQGKRPLAQRYLEEYLKSHPDDTEALALRARLLAEAATTTGQVLDAAQATDLVLRRDPDGATAQELRRRLVALYLRLEGAVPPGEVRYRTAESIARDYLERAARDKAAADPARTAERAEVHRLLGRALEGEYRLGDRDALTRRAAKDPRGRSGAIEELEAAAALDPADIDGAERLARLQVEAGGKGGEAASARTLDAMLAANRDDPKRAAAAHLARARVLEATAEGRPERAAAVAAELDAAIRLAPADVEARLAKAEQAVARKDLATAAAQIDALPESARDTLPVREFQGQLELLRNHPEIAVESWRKGLRLAAAGPGGDAKLYRLSFNLARIDLYLGRIAEADPLIAQVRRLSAVKDPPPARFLDGLRALKTNRPAAAIAILQDVALGIGTLPASLHAELYLDLGEAFEAVQDPAKALEAYRRAAASPPKSPNAYRAIVRLLAARADNRGLDEAVELLRRGLVEQPDEPTLMVMLAGVLLTQQERLPAARRDFGEVEGLLKRAERRAPNAPGLVAVQGQYLADVGRLDEAVRRLGTAAEKFDPKNAELWRRWAVGLAAQGKVDEALRALERGAAPENAGDQYPLRVERAHLLSQQGKGREAQRALTRDWQALPPSQRPLAWRAASELLRSLGDRDGARKALLQWAELAPDDPTPGLRLLEVGLADDDAAAVEDGLRTLKGLREAGAVYGPVARAYELLQGIRPTTTAAERARRLAEAAPVVAEVRRLAPKLWAGAMLAGLLDELRDRPEPAIAAYQQARELGAGAPVTRRLIVLLAKQKRFDDLAKLRQQLGADPELDRLAAAAALEAGDRGRAEELAARVVAGDPDGLQAHRWQAEVLSRVGKTDQGEADLRKLVEQAPERLDAWLTLLAFQVQQKRPAAAVAATVEAAAKAVKADRPELLKAQCFRLARDDARAAAAFRAALEKAPDDPETLLAAADVESAADRPAAAEPLLRRALDRGGPTLGRAARGLALVLADRAGDYPAWREAWELVKPGGPAGGEAPADRLSRAEVLARGVEPDQRREAVRLLEGLAADLPAANPGAVAARNLLNRLYREAGDAEKARAALEPVATGPSAGDPTAIARFVDALLRDKKPDQAARQLDRLTALEPKALRTDLLRAQVLRAQGRKEEADKALEAAYRDRAGSEEATVAGRTAANLLLEADADAAAERIARDLAGRHPGQAVLLAFVLDRRGRPAEALDACKEAVAAGAVREAAETAVRVINPAPGRPRATPALLAQAADVLKDALKLRPDDPQAMLALAHVRYFQGDHADEVRLYREALAHKPPNYSFLNNMAYVLCEELGEPAEALERIDEALRRLGPNPTMLDTKGLVLVRLGRFDDALAALKQAEALAAAKASTRAAIAFHQALADRGLGRGDEAKAAAARARQAGHDPAGLSARERKDWEALDRP
jgi:Tfp pilus assembly protein PilF